jgi:protein-S-isoprenylcysteine O-methyltransferase Ste14
VARQLSGGAGHLGVRSTTAHPSLVARAAAPPGTRQPAEPPLSGRHVPQNLGFLSSRRGRLIRILATLVGAGGAAVFAKASVESYLHTHLLIGAAFVVEQTWVVVAYLIRRPARLTTLRFRDWLLAFGGTFGGVLFRPGSAHPLWGVNVGLGVQLLGLAICLSSFLALGRSFGFAAANRGLVARGPYAVVRHPIYASYLLLQGGYVLQSPSLRNGLVLLFVTSCNVGRALAEERLLSQSAGYRVYRNRVRRRLIPGIW